MPECSYSLSNNDLCEAERALPDGNTNYDINNCPGDYDVFRYVSGNFCFEQDTEQKYAEISRLESKQSSFKSLMHSNLAEPMYCEWSTWEIGSCSMACGGGTRTNTRRKIWANDRGSKCEGNGNVEEKCSTHDCPGKL